jgi:hypothetical protein
VNTVTQNANANANANIVHTPLKLRGLPAGREGMQLEQFAPSIRMSLHTHHSMERGFCRSLDAVVAQPRIRARRSRARATSQRTRSRRCCARHCTPAVHLSACPCSHTAACNILLIGHNRMYTSRLSHFIFWPVYIRQSRCTNKQNTTQPNSYAPSLHVLIFLVR